MKNNTKKISKINENYKNILKIVTKKNKLIKTIKKLQTWMEIEKKKLNK